MANGSWNATRSRRRHQKRSQRLGRRSRQSEVYPGFVVVGDSLERGDGGCGEGAAGDGGVNFKPIVENMTAIKKIKSEIADANFLAAIESLKLVDKDDVYENEIVHLESRFKLNERGNRQGTLSNTDYNLESNKIAKALLDICAELEKHQKQTPKAAAASPKSGPPTGYCIRTRQEIPFNMDKPLCKEAFDVWVQFEDVEYPEKFCHFSGEPSNGETCFRRPVLRKNWNKAREIHGF